MGDEESVFDRLWAMLVGDRLSFMVPLRVIKRPETLTILDYRPTFFMFLTAAGFVVMTVMFVLFFLRFGTSVDLALWITGIVAVVLLVLTFRGTIRESYYFDRSMDTYVFVRQFIYRREVIQGSMSQFSGAYVTAKTNYDSESNSQNTSYFVALQQQGMFQAGVSEHILREEVPIFNSAASEAKIANAISGFLAAKV